MADFSNTSDVVDLLRPNYLIIGIFMFVWYYGTLFLYLSVLWILVRRNDFKGIGCYRLLFYLGIMDIYAVLDWTSTCWFMVFGANPLKALFGVGWIMSPTIDDVGFFPTNIMTLALAINRFVAISGFSIGISEKLFANMSAVLSYFLIVFLILLNIIPISIFKNPDTFVYTDKNLTILNFHNRVGCPNSIVRPFWFLGETIHVLQIGALIVAVFIYVCCIMLILARRRKSGTSQMTSTEWRMLFLTLIPCAVKTITQMYFYYFCPGDYIGQLLQLWMLVLEQGYHPFLYIIVNKRIRFHISRLYRCTHIQVNITSEKKQTTTQRASLQRFGVITRNNWFKK